VQKLRSNQTYFDRFIHAFHENATATRIWLNTEDMVGLIEDETHRFAWQWTSTFLMLYMSGTLMLFIAVVAAWWTYPSSLTQRPHRMWQKQKLK
jgi:hypothetical protein